MTLPNDTDDGPDVDAAQDWTSDSWQWDTSSAKADKGDDGDEAKDQAK